MRRKLVLANWKMHGSLTSNSSLLAAISTHISTIPTSADVGICVPAVYLEQVQRTLRGVPIAWGIQDISAHERGAFTGEISAAMAAEFDSTYAIVGHSERRQYHGESDETVGAKAHQALAAGLTPVVCVGETLQQRDADETECVVRRQLSTVLRTLQKEDAELIVVAYEPVWAIGTGRSATIEQVQTVHAVLRNCLREHSPSLDTVRILYGGSVKPKTAQPLFECDDVDGALVGGASLVADDFTDIIHAATSSRVRATRAVEEAYARARW